MVKSTYRGVVQNGKVVLLDAEPPLGDGTEVLVTPMPAVPGSGAAVLAAVENSAPVPGEWVDELEMLIAAGEVPPSRPDPFGEEGGPEGR